MKNKIIILEGSDGTGKSTLAYEILKQTKGHLLHGSYNKNWDSIKEYHRDIVKAANLLTPYQDIVIDRLSISEYVYGTVFRGGPEYDIVQFLYDDIDELNTNRAKVVWVYCTNDNVVRNHLKNKTERPEMFDSMADVHVTYEDIVQTTDDVLHFKRYNFETDGRDLTKYVKELLK